MWSKWIMSHCFFSDPPSRSVLKFKMGHCRQGMLKAYRFILQMPAWVTVDVTGRVDPGVSGSNSPSARVTNFSVIAAARIRSPSPRSRTS